MKTALIVEDEIVIAMINKHIIESIGFDVIDIVSSGEEAVESALKNKPDLILMDIMLTGKLDGIDAIIEIHKQKYIPVIYVSGNSDSRIRLKANNTKFIEYFIKPLDMNLFIQKVKQEFNL